MRTTAKHYIILNLIVLIWGFTGVLGDQISIGSESITYFRTGIAFVSLVLLSLFAKQTKPITWKQRMILLFTGVIVGLHWWLFFEAIKVSTVSLGVVCMSSSTLFTAIIEPFFFKRKHELSEFYLSLVIIAGIVMIFGFEQQYHLGIIYGLTSSFLASLFGVMNGIHIKKMPPLSITKYEMLGAFFAMGVLLTFQGKMNFSLYQLGGNDLIMLLILGIICTSLAFMVSVWIMKFVSPFTVSMSINMEPIYAILIALLLSWIQETDSEKMSFGFYAGTILILTAIFTNAYLKQGKKKNYA